MGNIEIEIEPIGKPRMTQRDKTGWKQTKAVRKYFAWKTEFVMKCRVAGVKGLGGELRVVFVIPFPRSYSVKRKKYLDGKPHEVKPDIDNIEKAVMDCLCKNDSHVHTHHTRKIWGYEGKIIFEK